MILLRDSSGVPAPCRHAVLALGNFDGLHLGHQAILRQAVSLAKAEGRQAGVLTFEPHPRRVFTPSLPPLRIFPFREKARLLAECGIEFMRVVRFTKEFAQTSAEDFVSGLLAGQMQAAHLVTGEDFTFGHNRAGNVALLHKLAARHGMKATACNAVLEGGERCSSTRLRELLAAGDMTNAAALLGRPYHISGIVRAGDKRGRGLGFPTANILPHRIFLPASGVYAVRAQIDGTTVNGIAHLGPRPVFSSEEIRLETHFFDFNGDLYGRHLAVELIARIRGERAIGGIEELKRQIAEDCEKARCSFI